MDLGPEQLLPRPRQSRLTGETALLPARPTLVPGSRHPGIGPAAEHLARGLEAVGLAPSIGAGEPPPGGGPPIHLRIEAAAGRDPQGYRLVIGPRGAELTAAGEAGLFYAACTAAQWAGLHRHRPEGGGLALPGLEVDDAPDFRHRGVLIDVSRDKVPTMATLFAIADRLAGWKVNQLQLYTEHTFAYRGHEVVWRGASPLTPEEVRELDAYCRARFVELVPNQNSFGHLHRWLVHEPYRRLAECPEGVEHPFSERREPFSLCPLDPGSFELLADLYDQLLPCFTSRQLNAGLDETLDLGLCRSAAACAELGAGRVYLGFLRRVHALATERGRRLQFWADVVAEHPEIAGDLPGDAVALEWGYEADHPFAERLAPLARSGLELYACPGTSSWMSLAGRPSNAVANIATAARAGREAGASGILVTDWGDFGHLQPPAVSDLGLACAAAAAWNTADADDLDPAHLAALLDLHAFGDRAGVMGRALWDLGEAHLASGARPKNGTALFHLLSFPSRPLTARAYAGISADGLRRAREEIGAAMQRLPGARMARPDADLVVRELSWVASLLELACDLGVARLGAGPEEPLAALPKRERRALARRLGPLIEEHRSTWLARNRPGGLADSAARLERLRNALRG